MESESIESHCPHKMFRRLLIHFYIYSIMNYTFIYNYNFQLITASRVSSLDAPFPPSNRPADRFPSKRSNSECRLLPSAYIYSRIHSSSVPATCLMALQLNKFQEHGDHGYCVHKHHSMSDVVLIVDHLHVL